MIGTKYLSNFLFENLEIPWLLFGFSDYGEVANADLVLYRTDSTDKQHFQVKAFILRFY